MDSRESFWEGLFLDQDQRQTRAIRRMDDSLSHLMEHQSLSTENLFRQVRDLYALDREQEREMGELRAIVRVLGQFLVELGIDESVLRYRMEAAIDTMRAEEEEQQSQEKIVTCARCGKDVPLRSTNITGDGTVCDSCVG